MRADSRLDSVIFQLTPTRTRCDLVIVANGKNEKIASGLLNPFLAHLKAAKDQIAKGGYSISLQPDSTLDAPWFTKGTVERFVRFVSTPEVLERVSTIESEILQIEEAIVIQGNENLGLSTVEDHQTKSLESIEGSKPVLDADADTAIVLYKPGSQSNPSDSNGSTTQEENSKIQLLRVLETRKTVLQKEQAMAFARATAAGFDIDHMSYLISFADSFGASRLKDACLRFTELWKIKHETGQWLEIEPLDLMSTRSGFSPFNASGIVLSGDVPPSVSSADDLSDLNREKRLPSDPHAPQGSHEYFQHPGYPSWPMHAPPGQPMYPPYPMPYYPGPGPYYPPPYAPVDDPRFASSQRENMRRHSMNSKNSNTDSQDDDELERSLSDFDKDGSRGRKSHKRSGKKIVIKNLNYIASKRHGSSDESQSASDSETGEESEGSRSKTVERKHKKSSKKNGPKKSSTNDNYGQDADSGNWNAFQSFLLKAEDKMSSAVDDDMFAGEKEAPIKRKQIISETEPSLAPDRYSGDIHESRVLEFDSVDGRSSRARHGASNDEFLTSADGNSHSEVHFREIEGGGGFKRASSDDFVVHGRENQTSGSASFDPIGDHEYQQRPVSVEKSSYVATDESFIMPLRSESPDHHGTDDRTAMDMDLEYPSLNQRNEDSSSNARVEISYEPDDLTLMPERDFESEYVGYDPALDYDMEIPVKIPVAEDDVAEQEVKEEVKEEAKAKKLKDGPEKRRKDAMARRGMPSRTSPLTEAQKRAEALRAYKVDLQKAKRENEEEQRKRLEALKLERQKRIAARSGSNAAHSPTAAKAKTGVPTKISPNSFKGSKFSDAEPSSHSPVTKLPTRSSSIVSNKSKSSGTGLSRSVSSLPEVKKESNGDITEAKATSERLRRLSEPKQSKMQPASHQVSKRIVTNEPQVKKISEIVKLDKTKSATLPELKIRTPKASSDTLQKATGSKNVPTKTTGEKLARVSYTDDNTVIEKTVVMLEKEMIAAPVVQPSEVVADMNGCGVGDHSKVKMNGLDSESLEYVAVRAPPSPVVLDEIEDSNHGKQHDQLSSYEVVHDIAKDEPQTFPDSVTENSYQAPYARTSTMEDPPANITEYSETPAVANPEMPSIQNEPVIRARLSSFSDTTSVEPIQQGHDSSEKPRSKESKGFRKLLKFGRKSHASSSGEGNANSDAEDQGEASPSKDVHVLKNLISQDETGSAPVKAHRSFSILSPFRSSKNSEK